MIGRHITLDSIVAVSAEAAAHVAVHAKLSPKDAKDCVHAAVCHVLRPHVVGQSPSRQGNDKCKSMVMQCQVPKHEMDEVDLNDYESQYCPEIACTPRTREPDAEQSPDCLKTAFACVESERSVDSNTLKIETASPDTVSPVACPSEEQDKGLPTGLTFTNSILKMLETMARIQSMEDLDKLECDNDFVNVKGLTSHEEAILAKAKRTWLNEARKHLESQMDGSIASSVSVQTALGD